MKRPEEVRTEMRNKIQAQGQDWRRQRLDRRPHHPFGQDRRRRLRIKALQ